MKATARTISKNGRSAPKSNAAHKERGVVLTRKYQAIFNNGRPIVILEADATISLANAEFERLSGYPRKEIEGHKRLTEFVARGDRKRMRECHRMRRSDPILTPLCFEFRFIDRQGAVKSVVLTMGQIPGTNKSMASLLDVTDHEQESLHRDSTELKEKTAKLAKVNKALQKEITRRKRAEEALREAEKRYRDIFDSMLEGYFEVDLAGNFTFFNKAVYKFYGYSRAKLMGMNYREFTSPEEAERLLQVFSEIYQTGNPREIDDYEIIKKDGSRGIAELSAFLLRNAAGEPIGFRGVTRDVTEKRKAVEDLRESEEKYRSMLANIGDAYTEIDLSGRITFYNKTVSASLGYTEEEFLGMHYNEYTSPEQAKKIYDIYSRVYKTGEPAKSVELEYRAKDGTKRILESTVDLLRDKSGKPIGFKTFTNDITQQRRAEEALRRSEEKYRNILASIQEGYFETDLDGNYTFVNDANCRYLGYTRKELIGMNYKQHTEEEIVKKLFPHYKELYETGKPIESLEFEGVRKDGTKVIYDTSVTLMRDSTGKPIGFRGVSRDVTERKQAEETLRRSEERYRTILETLQDNYYEVDLAGNYTFVNDALCRNFGYTKEELIGTKSLQHQDEANATKTYHAFKESYRTGKPFKALEVEYTRKDGTKGTYELSISLRKDAHGKTIGFGGISHDITERKRTEEALRENEEKYRSMLANIGDAYTETDFSGRITFYNKAVSASLGYTEEEFVGMHYKEYTSPEQAKKLYDVYSRVYKTGEPAKSVELEYRAKDGTTRILESTVDLLRDKSGKPIGFKTFTNDITQQRQAEETLRQSEERYRTIIENIQDGYYETDLAGRFTFVNDVVGRNIGYTKEELIGKDNRHFQDEENAKKIYEAFKEIYKTGEPVRVVESEYIRKDGTKRTYEMSASLIRDAEGKPIGYRGITRDVTERKKAEEQLKRYAEELERSNEEVKNFAYIVSHDLRVPLVNLKGYTSELCSALGVVGSNFDAALPHLTDEARSDVAMALHEDVPEALEFISNAVSRMDSFINAVLILSRLGRRELKPEPLDMEAVVQMSLEHLSHQIQEHGIEVTVGPLPEVVADRTAMEQIVGNILGNAVKYIDTERPAKITVTAKPNNTETVFRIQDTGRGIAQDDMHKVFAPFRRAGKQDTPGEGMGLAYVQILVRRHGGRIWCESEVGKGTTFTFTIATPSGKGAHDA